MVSEAKRMFQRRRTAAQWTSENPTLAAGELGFETDTGLLKIGNGTTAWNSLGGINVLAELVADDPSEVDLDTAVDTTTIKLTDAIARLAFPYENTLYYFNTPSGASTAQALTLNTLYFAPVILRAGVIDRIAVNVSTAAATATIRMGIYGSSAGRPGNRVAECTSGADTYPADASTTGAKNCAISATIVKNGLYWIALVNQTAAVSIQGGPNTITSPWTVLPQGTTAPTNTNLRPVLTQASVTGALPSSASASNSPDGTRIQLSFRYSS